MSGAFSFRWGVAGWLLRFFRGRSIAARRGDRSGCFTRSRLSVLASRCARRVGCFSTWVRWRRRRNISPMRCVGGLLASMIFDAGRSRRFIRIEPIHRSRSMDERAPAADCRRRRQAPMEAAGWPRRHGCRRGHRGGRRAAKAPSVAPCGGGGNRPPVSRVAPFYSRSACDLAGGPACLIARAACLDPLRPRRIIS